MDKQLLSVSNDPKTRKGEALGYLTGILYMRPTFNLCTSSTVGCRAGCLYRGGRGQLDSVKAARARKTEWFKADSHGFTLALEKDIVRLCKRADKNRLKPCVRLNGTSDIMWERHVVRGGKTLFELFSDVQFYDYTKHPPHDRTCLPANYDLTFSRSESNEGECYHALQCRNWNVAVVFDRAENIPGAFKVGGLLFPVKRGDEHDLRFLDPRGYVVALTAKGPARKDRTGFVVRGGDTEAY